MMNNGINNSNNFTFIKVLHFVHWSRSGVTSLIKSLARNDHKFVIHGLLLLLHDDNFQEYYQEFKNKCELNATKNYISTFLKARKFYKKFNPNIVHAHSFTPLLFSLLFFPKSHLIFHVHSEYLYLYSNDLKSIFKRNILKLILKFNNISIVVVNNNLKNYFYNKYGCKLFFLLNGVPDEGQSRKLFSEQSHCGRFFTVSRLHKDKNLEYAIELIVSLIKKGYRVNFDIYGDGDEKNSLQNIINDKCVGSFIRLKGFTCNPQLLSSIYDFYISTSKIEGLSLSTVDAIRGLNPVVMTRCGELSEILEDGKSALFLDFNHETALHKMENFLALSNDLLDFFQKNGRIIYEKKFHINRFIDDLHDIYKNIMSI